MISEVLSCRPLFGITSQDVATLVMLEAAVYNIITEQQTRPGAISELTMLYPALEELTLSVQEESPLHRQPTKATV